MSTTPDAIAFERGIEPVLQIVLPDKIDAILKFRPSEEIRNRIEELAAKSTEGTLDEAELAEYEGYVRANKFIAILQKQARRLSVRS